MILGVKDLLVQEVDPEQPLLWAQRVWMDCLGSLVFREPQEEMEIAQEEDDGENKVVSEDIDSAPIETDTKEENTNKDEADITE